MLRDTMYSILNYIKNGFYCSHNYELALKIYHINMFSTISLFLFLVLGTQNIFNGNHLIASILYLGALLFLLNMLYLKYTQDDKFSAFIVVYFLLSLMLYLLLFGGIHNTGPIWSLVLPPIVLFIHGFKRGLFELLIYLIIVVSVFFMLDTVIYTYYHYEFKVRIIIILSVIIYLSSLYQYTREISMKKMHQLQTDLEFYLRRDPLTGLYNRRGYTHHISKINQSSYGAILMCDIDHFKIINDTFGHSAGDAVLKHIATMIQKNIRKDDISVRWGGEEFFIFLANVTLNEAYSIAESIRQNIHNMPIVYQGQAIDVSMSIGISILNKDILLNDAIICADNAMYLSKSLGRNKTTLPKSTTNLSV